MTGLGFERRDGSGSVEGYMGHGIFIDDAQVVSIVNLSGKTTERQKYARDLAVEVTFKILKNNWDRTVTIGGNFKKDEQTGAVIDWGAAFKVRNFFLDLGIAAEDMNLEDDNSIPLHLLAKAEGRQCLMLSYRNKRGKSSSWDQIALATGDREEFKKSFLDEWNRSGYPRNYSPDSSGPVGDEPWSEGKTEVTPEATDAPERL